MFNTTSILESLGVVVANSDSSSSAWHATVQQIDTCLLRDDNVQVMSSLQLNQIASYTFHESSIANGQDLSEQIIEMLGRILSKPCDHSVWTLQKTLVVLKHILIFGAEKNLNACLPLGRFVQEELLNYNTALIAQQQTGATGMLLRLKGGAVDKGGPVRDVAQVVHMLLTNRQQLQWERSHQQDPTSLVPVGSNDKCAFATDEVRFTALQQRIKREKRVEIKSNLAKQESAFGGGYNARDGKNVVGAAHGIEEMMKQAQREKMKFSDDTINNNNNNNANNSLITAADFAEYMAPTEADLLQTTYNNNSNNHNRGSSHHVQHQPIVVVDDFLSQTPTAAIATEDDLLGFGGGGGGHQSSITDTTTADLLGGLAGPSTTTAALIGAAAVVDPFGGAGGITPSLLDVSATPAATTTVMKSKNIMSSSSLSMNNSYSSVGHDPFAALDTLGSPSSGSAIKSCSASAGTGGTTGGGLMMGLSSLSFNMNSSSSNGAATTTTTAPTLSAMKSNPLTDLSSLSLMSLTTPSTVMPVVIVPPTVSATSMRVSQTIPGVNYNNNNDDDGGGFVMGGTVGSGLLPGGPAPAAAPPPPPPPPGSSLW